MSVFNTQFGGARWLALTPPDWENVFGDWSALQPQLSDGGGDNLVDQYVLSVMDFATREKLVRWKRPDDLDADLTDTDQVMLYNPAFGPTDFPGILWCRASGTGGNEDGYYCGVHTSGELYIRKMVAGSPTTLANTTAAYPDMVFDVWYWVQFRVVGDSLKARYWKDGDPVPQQWTLDITDSSFTAAGWVGLGSTSNGGIWFDWYSIGTEGDSPQLYTSVPQNDNTSNINTITALPTTLRTDATSLLVYVGYPLRAVDWSLTGDGTLTVISDYTDSAGRAYAKYSAGTEGTKTIDVVAGTP